MWLMIFHLPQEVCRGYWTSYTTMPRQNPRVGVELQPYLPRSSGKQPEGSPGAVSKLYQCQHKFWTTKINRMQHENDEIYALSTSSSDVGLFIEAYNIIRRDIRQNLSTYTSTTRRLTCSLVWYRRPGEYRLLKVNGRAFSWENDFTIRIDQGTKSIEEPAVAVKLLLVLLLQTEDDLNRTGTRRHFSSIRDHNI